LLPSGVMFDVVVLGSKAFDIELYQINAFGRRIFRGLLEL
jgi:hypothetical protein